MNRVLLLLLLLTIAACSPRLYNASSGGSPATPPTAGSPTAVAATATIAGGSTIKSPSPSPAATPALPLPITLSAGGWITYTSASLRVALNYPPAWTVHAQGTGALFTSPQGATIALDPVDTGFLSPADYLNGNDLPNTRCFTQTNPHDVTLRICLDTIAVVRTAYFVIASPPTVERLLSLVTGRRGDPPVFNAMLESIRPAS